MLPKNTAGSQATFDGFGRKVAAARTQIELSTGAPGWIRTSCPRLRRPVLYPYELRARAGTDTIPRNGNLRGMLQRVRDEHSVANGCHIMDAQDMGAVGHCEGADGGRGAVAIGNIAARQLT